MDVTVTATHLHIHCSLTDLVNMWLRDYAVWAAPAPPGGVPRCYLSRFPSARYHYLLATRDDFGEVSLRDIARWSLTQLASRELTATFTCTLPRKIPRKIPRKEP